MPRDGQQLIVYSSWSRLVHVPARNSTDRGLREDLKTWCQAGKLAEECESCEHPELVGVRNTIFPTA
jgi:hypothetical protein